MYHTRCDSCRRTRPFVVEHLLNFKVSKVDPNGSSTAISISITMLESPDWGDICTQIQSESRLEIANIDQHCFALHLPCLCCCLRRFALLILQVYGILIQMLAPIMHHIIIPSEKLSLFNYTPPLPFPSPPLIPHAKRDRKLNFDTLSPS